LTERFIPPEAAGGVVTFVIRRRDKRAPVMHVSTRVRRGGVASLRLRLPRVGPFAAPALYSGAVSFAGTQFAAPRSSIPAFLLAEQPAVGGRSELQFGPPCLPHRC
jgi:hypothetical protein